MPWRNICIFCFLVFSLPVQAEEPGFTPKTGIQFLPELICVDKNSKCSEQILTQPLQVTAPVLEDPDWYVAPPGSNRLKPRYVGCWAETQYLFVLKEALQGNPVAMADLIIRIQCTSSALSLTYPNIPDFMHSTAFWLDWAAQYTSPGWVYTRLALYDEGIGHTRSAFTKGAFLGDPKSMHAYATRWNTGSNLQWLLLAADAGYAPAAHVISRWYRFGGEQCGYALPNSPDQALAHKYLVIAMNQGHARAFGDAAYEILTSEDAQARLKEAYMYTQIGRALEESDDGLLLVGRPLPTVKPVTLDDVLGYARYVLMPPHSPLGNTEKQFSQIAKFAKGLRKLDVQDQSEATIRAVAWLRNFQKRKEADMAAERTRRGVLTARLRERCLTALDYLATLPDPPIGKGAPYDGYVTTTGMSRFATPGSPISR